MSTFRLAALVCGMCLQSLPAESQTDSTALRVTGSVGVSLDLYDLQSTGGVTTPPRRPSSVFRMYANPTFSVSDWLEVPVNISYTSREAALIQPSLTSPNIMDVLSNPMNRFSISPRIGPVQVHLGSVVPRYGSLVVDNAQLFGLGVDATPGTLRLSAAYGILDRAVAADTTRGMHGSYARSLMAFRVGSEPDRDTRFGFTFARMSDDESSIPFITEDVAVQVPVVDGDGVVVRDSSLSFVEKSSLLPMVQEGVSFGFDMRVPIIEGIYLGAEIAGTGFTRDKSAPQLSEEVPVLDFFIKARTSTRIDAAGNLTVGYTSDAWGIEAGATYIGPGYVCLTQPYLQPDRLDVIVSPRFNVANGRLSGNATLGWRQTDVLNTLVTGSNQLLLSVSATGMVTELFTISGTYSNYGFRTTSTEDTLRFEQVSQTITFMPAYTIVAEPFRHQIAASASWDQFTDVTNQDSQSRDNTTLAVNIMYGLAPIRSEWTIRATASLMQNSLDVGGISARSLTLGGSYRIANGLLQPDAAVILGTNEINGLPEELQLTIRAGLQTRVSTNLTGFARVQYTSNGSNNSQGRDYRELLGSFGFRVSF